MRRNGGSGGANGCRSDLRDVSEERLLPVGKQLPVSARCRHRGPARGIQRDSWYAVMICAYALVGLMETTVRPIEDTPWVPVTHDSAPINKPEENDILPDAFLSASCACQHIQLHPTSRVGVTNRLFVAHTLNEIG